MIHVATIHHGPDTWIDLQHEYLRRYTGEPYRTYAFLGGKARRHREKFDSVLEGEQFTLSELPETLGRLADRVCEQGDPDDLLVFIHGDAFPIGDWIGLIRHNLATAPLTAVRRDENLGEPQPHAILTATTPAFWRRIGGTWDNGPQWIRTDGKPETDHGAALWRKLEQEGIDWVPILRSNRRDLHPVFFAVYGDVFYHHGAVFRMPITGADASASRGLPTVLRRAVRVPIVARNSWRSWRNYRRLRSGDEFFRELMADPAGGEGKAVAPPAR